MLLKPANKDNDLANLLSFGLGLGLGIMTSYQRFVKQAKKGRKIFYLKLWEKALAEEFGKTEAVLLAEQVQNEYQKLCASDTSKPAHRALRFHLYQSILPGLALYRVLLEKGLSRKAALVEIDRIFARSFSAGIKMMGYELPGINYFELLRKTIPVSLNFIFPQAGFEKEWTENSSTTIAFNIHSCFYLDVLAAHGARELTVIYCKFDDLMFNNMPASVRWERTETLGRGHKLCNFRWTNSG
jgi:hypothetical protein